MDSTSVEATLKQMTREVRRMLGDVEHEPVGVMTAYKLSILRLADAIDRLADELDSRARPS